MMATFARPTLLQQRSRRPHPRGYHLTGEFRKYSRDHSVDIAPKWYDEVSDAIEPLPSPRIEFCRLAIARRQRVDLVVAAGESHRKPFLPLPTKFGEAVRRRS